LANGGVFRNYEGTNGTTTFTGSISGSGQIRKTDTGTMRLLLLLRRSRA
jgi:hypothetical protein